MSVKVADGPLLLPSMPDASSAGNVFIDILNIFTHQQNCPNQPWGSSVSSLHFDMLKGRVQDQMSFLQKEYQSLLDKNTVSASRDWNTSHTCVCVKCMPCGWNIINFWETRDLFIFSPNYKSISNQYVRGRGLHRILLVHCWCKESGGSMSMWCSSYE